MSRISVAHSRRHVAWIGAADAAELAWARDRVAAVTELTELAHPGAPHEGSWPVLALLCAAAPARWTLRDATAVARRWPLAVIVSVGTSLAEGRRRSGPPLPGVEEVGWSDLPGRLTSWLVELDAGRPGAFGLPPAARREDRVLEAAAGLRNARGRFAGVRAAVVGMRFAELEGLAELLSAIGLTIASRSCGRPAIDEDADIVIWDAGQLESDQLAWLRMLAANRPQLPVVLLDSFPRSDTTLAALRSGAAAVLARPLSLEALSGTLQTLLIRPGTGLGAAPRHG